MRSLFRTCLIICIISVFSYSLLVVAQNQCSIYFHNCNECASNGCGWCALNQTCLDPNTPSSNCGCLKSKAGSRTSCSQIPCSALDNCQACALQECGWCEDTKTCVENKPPGSNTTGPCTGSQCNNLQCYKTVANTDFFATKCIASPTCIWNDCFDCVQNGCVWCDSTQRCLPSTLSGTAVCGSESCPNMQQCLKSNYSYNYYGARCPASSCSTRTNCRDCLDNGCGWCDLTQSCLPISNDLTQSCGPVPCADGQCWKKLKLTTAYEDKCTAANCSLNKRCSDCVTAGCGWCESSATCVPISNNLQQVCGPGGCDNIEKCFKSDSNPESKCSAAAPCNTYVNCYDCVRSGCGWCGLTGKCLPSQIGYNGSCGTETCDSSTGCWKARSDPAYSTYLCPPKSCSSINNCATCVQSGCGWCAYTGTCAEAQYVVNGTKSPGPCLGGCQNSDKCWKSAPQIGNLTSSTCTTTLTCSMFKDCVSCFGDSNNVNKCGWCRSTQTCVELSVDGSSLCADCDDPSVSPVGCVDCVKNGCKNNGICDIQTRKCQCPAGYYDPYCGIYCDRDSTCSSHGSCNSTNGLCVCDKNYYGDTCIYYCDPEITCSGHGYCNFTGSSTYCVCEGKWQELDCSNCPSPYFGDHCDTCCDVRSNCSMNGVCNNCTCDCYITYQGPKCDKFVGLTPKEAKIITAILFIALVFLTVITMAVILHQIPNLERQDFPGFIDLTKVVNIISVSVSVISYIQLAAFAFEAVESRNPAKKVVLPFILSSIPNIGFPVLFWSVIGFCVVWFLCVTWVLLSASKSSSMSNSAVKAFMLDLILTCLMPLVGNALYFPILKELFAAFACEYAPHNASMTLIADDHITCWGKTHFIYMGTGFIGFCLYYPLALRSLPLAQAMKVHYASYKNHIVYFPKYLLVEAQIKLLITLTKTFFREPWVHIASLGTCVAALMILQIFWKPCVSSRKVNLWRVVGYLLVLCCVASGVVAFFFPTTSYVPMIVLFGTWTVVLFLACFVHRAMFNADNILQKYKSITIDVNQKVDDEAEPLLKRRTRR